MSKLVQTCPNLLKLVQKSPNMSKLVQICPNWFKHVQNCWKWIWPIKNCSNLNKLVWNWSKMSKIDQTYLNLLKLVQTCSNLSKLFQSCLNFYKINQENSTFISKFWSYFYIPPCFLLFLQSKSFFTFLSVYSWFPSSNCKIQFCRLRRTEKSFQSCFISYTKYQWTFLFEFQNCLDIKT